MGYRRSWEKAHSSYWSLHVEAWRRSGLSRTEYCRRHGLKKKTFDRWMKHLIGVEEARKHAEELRELRRKERPQRRKNGAGEMPQRRRFGARTDTRSRAVQAFWAMHVEALNWSGMSVHDYATALLLSPWSLRKWRNRLDDGEVEIDWRAHLHPSARPQISTSVSSAAKESDGENVLTAPAPADPARNGCSNRRSFTDADKLAIVMEAEQPGVSAAAVCRRHNIATSMIFRWRVQFGFGSGKPTTLAAVRIADDARHGNGEGGADTVVLQDILPIPPGAVAVELADGRRVFAPPGSDPGAVRRYIAQQEENTRC
jgi:transposase-like protein